MKGITRLASSRPLMWDGGGVTQVTPMREEEFTNFQGHIAPFSWLVHNNGKTGGNMSVV